MKKLFIKIPAVIAMLISLCSFFFYGQYLFEQISDIWIGSAIFAMFSIAFYLVDGVISLVKAIKKTDSGFNYILAFVLIGGIPMFWIFGGDGNDFFNVIWNVYYLVMFVLEGISIKRIWDAAKAEK